MPMPKNLPKIIFKFAEWSIYSGRRQRKCSVTIEEKSVCFRFNRYGQIAAVHMAKEDFDDFLTWYHMAQGLDQAHAKKHPEEDE